MKNKVMFVISYVAFSSTYIIRGTDVTIKKSSQRSVSILKPLIGADKNLHANLESFFNINYKHYELLLCVKDPHDPAVMVVKSLMKKYPKVDSQLIIGGSNVGINPKVNNMIPGYNRSKYDLIMISDDKMLIQPDALQEMVNKISSDTSIGIVAQIPSFYVCQPDIYRLLDCIISTIQLTLPLLTYFTNMTVILMGMSILIEKEIFVKAGGLKTFSAFISEDIEILRFASKNGWTVGFSRFLGLQYPEDTGFKFQFKRMSRWMKVLSVADIDLPVLFLLIVG
jgi:ceramide glucosyltransferase